YTLSAWVLGTATVGARNFGGSTVSVTKTASSWTQVSVSFTPSATSAEIFAAWAGGGDARVDDFELAPSTTTPPPDSAQITPPGPAVSASTSDANLPAQAVDKNLATRWSGNGDGAWLRLDLGADRAVGFVKVAVYNGTARRNRFDLQVSSDGATWTTVWSGQS